MKAKRIIADEVRLTCNVPYARMEVFFGASFYLGKFAREFQLNLTPAGDLNLVPIENFEIGAGMLNFSTTLHGKTRFYQIDYQNSPFGAVVSSFLETFINRPLVLDKQYSNSFSLWWESGTIHLRLSHADGRSISYFYPTRRGTHLYRRANGTLQPDHFQDANLTYKDDTVFLAGTPVNPPVLNSVQWKLDFQPELMPVVRQLLVVTLSLFSESKTIDNVQTTEREIPQKSNREAGDAILDKHKLEELIALEKSLGKYYFDESEQCFITDVEVVVYLTKEADEKYRVVCYFIDGYEVGVEADESEHFTGDEAIAMQQAIASFSQESFLNYPIVYSNITCNLYEEEA